MSAHPRTFNGYAAFDNTGECKPWQFEPRPLGDEDVEIKVTHCGICGSDVHTLDSGWGPTPYPSWPATRSLARWSLSVQVSRIWS